MKKKFPVDPFLVTWPLHLKQNFLKVWPYLGYLT